MLYKIFSWNVLHIVHEINHCSDSSLVIKDGKTINEVLRIEQIIKQINDVYDPSNTFICLQEVPGDLRDKLIELKFNFYEYQLPRMPSVRNSRFKNTKVYSNFAEYLITIVPKDLTFTHSAVQYIDQGKSCLIVKNDKFSILNTHLPFNAVERVDSLTKVYKAMSQQNNYILVGDTNTQIGTLTKECSDIGFDFKFPNIKGNTRVGLNDKKIYYSKIDHIMTKNIDVARTVVIRSNDLSDHYLVGGEFSL